jgi:CheY-like chemotaxis protein
MNFKILYVEDEADQAERVRKAVAEINTDRRTSRPVLIRIIRSPTQLYHALSDNYDLVLADVYFPDENGEPSDQLGLIIETTERWSADRKRTKALPIIAYTSRGKSALEACLKRRERLYDIWDKFSASPPYVAWRFNQLALEFARARPDTLLQRKIWGMKEGAKWHDCVIDMVHRYNAGWTERDQVKRSGVAIENIAHRLNAFDTCDKSWRIMIDWEALGRAVSRRTRGHARHVINVFWLGYYLLHHPKLEKWFSEAWAGLVTNRSNMAGVAKEKPLEALSNAWFYAALFHDIGGCVEKNKEAIRSTDGLLKLFGGLVKKTNLGELSLGASVRRDAKALFEDMEDRLRDALFPLWLESVRTKEPDHGVISALYLTTELKENPKQLPYALEAARAMIVHNLVGDLKSKPATVLRWETEPLACLLILCDQLQTWDRNRGDKSLGDTDEPDRAELSTLNVEENAKHETSISIGIDYIAPRHLDHAPQQFAAAKDALAYILKDKPNRALSRISQPWPFRLSVECWLNSQSLDSPMHF